MPPTPTFNTLEEAQAEIIRLNEALNESQTNEQNYSNRITELEGDLEKVREINQKYFLKLSAQYAPPGQDEPDEPDAPTCVDFAKTLTI